MQRNKCHVFLQQQEILVASSFWSQCCTKKEQRKLEFRISSLTGNVVYDETMVLDELPERKPGTTRIRLEMKMVSDNTIYAVVTDLGFGEFYPATGKKWEKEIVLEFKE